MRPERPQLTRLLAQAIAVAAALGLIALALPVSQARWATRLGITGRVESGEEVQLCCSPTPSMSPELESSALPEEALTPPADPTLVENPSPTPSPSSGPDRTPTPKAEATTTSSPSTTAEPSPSPSETANVADPVTPGSTPLPQASPTTSLTPQAGLADP